MGDVVVPPPGTALVVRFEWKETKKEERKNIAGSGNRPCSPASLDLLLSPLSHARSPPPLSNERARHTHLELLTLISQEELDRRLLVQLRDGRKLLGTLRSFDQFANLVLERTLERVVAVSSKLYADVPLGLYVVRGENVVLLGRLGDGIDRGGEDEAPPGLSKAASAEAARAAAKAEREAEKLKKGIRARMDFLDLDL